MHTPIKLFIFTVFVGICGTAHANMPAKYPQTCGVCHDNGNLGAPKKGDKQAWNALKTKGMDALVQSVNEGMPQMPKKGLCNDCNDDQLRQMIEYMAQ